MPAGPLRENLKDANTDSVWMIGNSMQDVETAYNSNIKPVIFSQDLVKEILWSEGIDKNKKALYIQNHLELLKILEKFNENTEIVEI